MIKKLKKSFVLTAVAAAAAVLLIIMSVIFVTNYIGIVKDADNLISALSFGGGIFKEPPAGFNGEMPKRFSSEEAQFETRYFTAEFSAEGDIITVNTGRIAAVTDERARVMAKKIYSGSRERGFDGIYRYAKKYSDAGCSVTFLDCTRELDSFKSFLITSALVCALGMLAVFILSVLMSGRAVKPLAESYEKQKQFITNASHELKTPLTVISANTDILEMEQGESEWTKSIHNQVERLTSLTGSLVALSRMDEEKPAVVMTDFSLSDAVSEGAEGFFAIASSEGKTLEASVEKNISFNGDEKAIRQLVNILLDNALKYSDDGGRIELKLKKTGKGTELSVFNTLTEIEKGDHPELFLRFYRGDESRSSEKSGYGIGLSLGKSIVAAHKGKITAESRDGRSLTVKATFG